MHIKADSNLVSDPRLAWPSQGSTLPSALGRDLEHLPPAPDLPPSERLGRGLGSLLARIQASLDPGDLCGCLPPAFVGAEDRTLRRAQPPEVTDCRVEPPPPRRVDPFVFRAKIGPMEELLIVNLDQLDAAGRPIVVHQAKNGKNEQAELIIPDNNPNMPRTGDHLLVLARKYTNQIVDEKNVTGPWSEPKIHTVAPPRDAQGNLVRGYAEDMRAPYFNTQHIDLCSEGDIRVPGRRLFYSTDPFTIAPLSELRLSFNRGTERTPDWVELAKTTSSASGTFLFDVHSPFPGNEGYRIEILQQGQDKAVEFDPVRHAPFDASPLQVVGSLIDQLFSALPIDTTLQLGAYVARNGRVVTEFSSPAIAAGAKVQVRNLQCEAEPIIATADCHGKVSAPAVGQLGEQVQASVQQLVNGQKVWVPLPPFVLGSPPRCLEGSALPVVLGPEAGLKPGQRFQMVNDETKAITTQTVGPDGSLSLVAPNVSRGDLVTFEMEDWIHNKRSWMTLLSTQLDSARGPGVPRELNFSKTVDAPSRPQGWAALASLFATGVAKTVPPEERRSYLLGASFALATERYHLPAERFAFSGPSEEALKWFTEGFRNASGRDQRATFAEFVRPDAAQIKFGESFCDRIRVEERCQPTARNITGLTGRFSYQSVTRKRADTITLAANPQGITATPVQAGGY